VLPRILPADERHTVWRYKHRSILVPLDGSTFAEHAIPYAVGLAEQLGATLELAHIHPSYQTMDEFAPIYVDNATLRALKRRKRNYLNEVIQRISKQSMVLASGSVINGQDVADALRAVDFLDADFVVVATHARGLIGRFWSGGVVHRMLRHVEVPVMVVRGDHGPVSFAPKKIRRMLMPVDGTSTAEQALKTVATIAAIVGAEQTVMQIIRMEPNFVIRHGSLRTDWVPSQNRELQASRYLHGLKKSLSIPDVKMQTKVISSDDRIGDVIRSFAERSTSDVIAVTAQMIWLFSGLLLYCNAH
jgi:nucleotide-binding universal stress UspA family protein